MLPGKKQLSLRTTAPDRGRTPVVLTPVSQDHPAKTPKSDPRVLDKQLYQTIFPL